MGWQLLTPRGDLGDAGPHLDREHGVPLRQVLIIASSARTGSNMLGFGLAATGLAGRPTEYLNFDSSFLGWRRRFGLPTPTTRGAVGMLKRRLQRDPDWWRCYRWSRPSMLAYLDAVVAARSTPNGVFALKAHGHQFDRWRTTYGFDPGRWNVPVRWVHLRRDDVVAQAVSYLIAFDSKRWSEVRSPIERRVGQVPVDGSAAPTYSADRIARTVERLVAERDRWTSYFDATGVVPLTFSYEQLVDDYEGALRATLALVGEQVDTLPEPRTVRQASSINRDWIDRFVVDCPDLAASARGSNWR